MFDIVGHRAKWYLISLILMAPGILFMAWSLVTNGTLLPLSIDYTGGTQWEMRFEQPVVSTDVRQTFVEAGYSDVLAFNVEDANTVQVKFESIDGPAKAELVNRLTAEYGPYEERYYRSIGPTMGSEVSESALLAVVVSSVMIMLYVAWAFREVPHPFRYGAATIGSLVHDVLVTISFIGIMNWIAGWQIDALFLTAVLTVIGFSVNDTIVVFDRIRENLKRHRDETFPTIANRSMWETVHRSLATQVTIFLVMTALLIFGGASLRQFMATLLVGMISGTFSSIFNATCLVVSWQERDFLGLKRKRIPVTNGSAAVA